MKTLFYLISFMTLFLGVNILYTLGFKDPFDTSISLSSGVPLSTWLLLMVGSIYLFTKKKLIKNYEISFLIFCFIYTFFNTIILQRSANLVIIINSFIAPIFISLLAKNIPNAKKIIYKIIKFK